jgi:hypothetical protein
LGSATGENSPLDPQAESGLVDHLIGVSDHFSKALKFPLPQYLVIATIQILSR